MLRKLTFVLCVSVASLAQGRTLQEARLIARQEMQLDKINVLQQAESWYLLGATNGEKGVLVAAEERLGGVVATFDGEVPALELRADNEQLPEALRGWLRNLEQATAFVREHPESAISAQDRHQLPAASISPLLGSIKWNQNAPYNNLCPPGCPVGCVATAMAQIMYYWKYPEHGFGSHQYKWGSQYLSADFENTYYDWDNMRSSASGNSSQATKDAVAELSYHCGVSVDMNYEAKGSGSYEFNVPRALVQYFGYNPLISCQYRDCYTFLEWNELLYNELVEQRPILFCGQSPEGGHAFVLDGYQGNGYYHVNWGWGGSYNGYFDVCFLKPENVGTGATLSDLGFCADQSACIQIAPDTVGRFYSPVASMYQQLNGRVGGNKRAFSIDGYIMNRDIRKNTGKLELALCWESPDSIVAMLGSEDISVDRVWGWSSYHHTSNTYHLPDSLADGEYRLYRFYRPKVDGVLADYAAVVREEAMLRPYKLIIVQGDDIEYVDEVTYMDVAVSCEVQEMYDSGDVYNFDVKIYNPGEDELPIIPILRFRHSTGQFDVTKSELVRIGVGDSMTIRYPVLLDTPDSYTVSLVLMLPNYYGLDGEAGSGWERSFVVEATENSPARYFLQEEPYISAGNCAVGEEITLSCLTQNQGGNRNSKCAVQLFTRKSESAEPFCTYEVEDYEKVAMSETDTLNLTIRLDGVKGMTKYFARICQVDAAGNARVCQTEPGVTNWIELKVKNATAIETLPIEESASPKARYCISQPLGLYIIDGKVKRMVESL